MSIELSFIPALLVILLAAGVGRGLAGLIKQPVILGELILGVILGVFVGFSEVGGVIHEPLFSFLVIKDPRTLLDLADVGIMFLLFSIGLDLEVDRFKELAGPAVEVAVSGVVLPFALAYLAALYFGFSSSTGALLGASSVATSVGISASVLQESGKLRTRVGTLIMGSAVADDVIGIVIMTVVFGFATTGELPLMYAVLLVIAAGFFFVVPLTVGVTAFRKLSEHVSLGKENLLLFGLLILLLFGLLADAVGLAAITGAFVAGLLIGQTRFASPLKNSVSLIGGSFFVPIFFVVMGMRFDLTSFTSVGVFAVVFIITGIVGKIVGCGLGAKAVQFTNVEATATGFAMVPRAEVALVVASFGFKHGVLGADIVSAIVAMVLVTTLLAPPFLWETLHKERRVIPA